MKDIFTILSENDITIPEDRKEAFTKAFRANYKTVNEHKKTADDLEAANETIAQLHTDLQKYSGTDETIRTLQNQLQTYRDAEQERKAQDAMRNRFNAVKGDKQFVNAYTENGIEEAFRTAVNDTANAGKSDADIFLALVKDRKDVFVSAHSAPDIPGMGGNVDKALDAQTFHKLPLSEQMRFATEHPAEYNNLYGGKT